jgi:hypothetical protein
MVRAAQCLAAQEHLSSHHDIYQDPVNIVNVNRHEVLDRSQHQVASRIDALTRSAPFPRETKFVTQPSRGVESVRWMTACKGDQHSAAAGSRPQASKCEGH